MVSDDSITHHHSGSIITPNLLSLERFKYSLERLKYWCKMDKLILLKTRTVELFICLLIRNSTKNKSFIAFKYHRFIFWRQLESTKKLSCKCWKLLCGQYFLRNDVTLSHWLRAFEKSHGKFSFMLLFNFYDVLNSEPKWFLAISIVYWLNYW